MPWHQQIPEARSRAAGPITCLQAPQQGRATGKLTPAGRDSCIRFQSYKAVEIAAAFVQPLLCVIMTVHKAGFSKRNSCLTPPVGFLLEIIIAGFKACDCTRATAQQPTQPLASSRQINGQPCRLRCSSTSPIAFRRR